MHWKLKWGMSLIGIAIACILGYTIWKYNWKDVLETVLLILGVGLIVVGFLLIVDWFCFDKHYNKDDDLEDLNDLYVRVHKK